MSSDDAIFIQKDQAGWFTAQWGMMSDFHLPDPEKAKINERFTDLEQLISFWQEQAKDAEYGFQVHLPTDPVEENPLSDGRDEYHTMEELYEYRMVYHAHACLLWSIMQYPVVKSRKHHDGELPFGGGFFIVTAQLPTGQVTNHYKDEYWDLFFVEEVDVAPEWDGHTPEEALKRLHDYITGEWFLKSDERE